MKKLPLLLPVLFVMLLPAARAQFTLVATGGIFAGGAAGSSDLAYTQGTAFAQDVLGGGGSGSPYPQHQISHLNDGLYGNLYSWIGDNGSHGMSFAGISFSSAQTIGSFAFGRDNGAGPTEDRFADVYTIQYTTVANPDASTPDSSWITVGTLDYTGHTVLDSFDPVARHFYNLDTPLVGVTGFRIEVNRSGLVGGTAIDEIELYASPIPEPSTYAAIFGALALGVAGLRRKVARLDPKTLP